MSTKCVGRKLAICTGHGRFCIMLHSEVKGFGEHLHLNSDRIIGSVFAD